MYCASFRDYLIHSFGDALFFSSICLNGEKATWVAFRYRIELVTRFKQVDRVYSLRIVVETTFCDA
jgi:thiamine transporter ThiT